MSADREIAQIYARQANRAGRAALAVVIGGIVATVSFAIRVAGNDSGVGIGILALGAALTAAVYALVAQVQARAEAAAVRHLATALDE